MSKGLAVLFIFVSVGCAKGGSSAGAAAAAPTTVKTPQILLTWTPQDAAQDGFLIESSTDNVTFNQIAKVQDPNAKTYSVADTDPTTKYYFRIRAYNSTAQSGYTAAITVNPVTN